MTKVWVIVGATGSFEYYTNWIVAVYTNKEQAIIHCNKCNSEANEIDNIPYGENGKEIDKVCEDNLYDHNCQHDSTGEIRYTFLELPLVCHLDEYLECSLREVVFGAGADGGQAVSASGGAKRRGEP